MEEDWREQLNYDLNKLWNGDISSLSNQEIMDILQNVFYQIFLVQITDLNFAIRTSKQGVVVKFIIEGDAYKDEENVEISDILEEEEEEEEEEE